MFKSIICKIINLAKRILTKEHPILGRSFKVLLKSKATWTRSNGTRKVTQDNDTAWYYWNRGYVSNEAGGASFTATNHIGVQGIFARTMDTTTHYLFKNGHGDVENIYPQETGATSSYTYDAYGNIYRYSPNYNDNVPITCIGEYLDEESGLIYLRNRYYNPSTGRFITEDPIKDGFNWYAQYGNSKERWCDNFLLDGRMRKK